MTTFEFYKAQLDDAVQKGLTERINPEIEPWSFKWIKVCGDWFFGGAWDYQMKEVTDVPEMKAAGFVKIREYTNWMNRHLGQTKLIALTNKGIREFYNEKIRNR